MRMLDGRRLPLSLSLRPRPALAAATAAAAAEAAAEAAVVEAAAWEPWELARPGIQAAKGRGGVQGQGWVGEGWVGRMQGWASGTRDRAKRGQLFKGTDLGWCWGWLQERNHSTQCWGQGHEGMNLGKGNWPIRGRV